MKKRQCSHKLSYNLTKKPFQFIDAMEQYTRRSQDF